jgi:hypothetical protein
LEEVERRARNQIEEPEERCVHRTFLKAVEKRFEVVRIYHGESGWFTAYVRRADFPENVVLTLVIRDDSKPDALRRLDLSANRADAYVDIARHYVSRFPEKHFAIWCADGISVDGDDRAVELYDYDADSGIVSNPRKVRQDGSVVEDQ